MNTYIGHNQFQNIVRCVAKLCKNWPGTSKNRWAEVESGTERVQALAKISRLGYVVIATKPVHLLHICPIVHN